MAKANKESINGEEALLKDKVTETVDIEGFTKVKSKKKKRKGPKGIQAVDKMEIDEALISSTSVPKAIHISNLNREKEKVNCRSKEIAVKKSFIKPWQDGKAK